MKLVSVKQKLGSGEAGARLALDMVVQHTEVCYIECLLGAESRGICDMADAKNSCSNYSRGKTVYYQKAQLSSTKEACPERVDTISALSGYDPVSQLYCAFL